MYVQKSLYVLEEEKQSKNSLKIIKYTMNFTYF